MDAIISAVKTYVEDIVNWVVANIRAILGIEVL